MSDKDDDGDARQVVPGKATDCDSTVLSDTISLSDSDPEDSTTPYDPEVEDLSSDESSDGDCSSGEPARRLGSAGTKEPFQLKGTSSGFSFRSQSIFDSLGTAGKRAAPSLGDDDLIDGPFVRPLPPLAKKKDAEHGAPKPLSKAVPDYLAHPERWTKYSLEDMPESSNQRNTAVAQEFMGSLQKRKGESMDTRESFSPAFNQENSSSVSGCRIVFSKPSRAVTAAEKQEEEEEGEEEECKGRERGREDSVKKVGLLHLKELEDEVKADLKRKRADEGEGAGGLVAAVGFHSSRKINRKNIRKTMENQKEDD
ncbi:U5 small nuclear ribonucleoprotein TSSC4-like [Acipenser ruthenus]|uniref:U5 small nuclear ribonucleoprotein TSSC4-like n=1 Tax=Acipenser ruthenus TaxID=7906 RepID=UPI002741A6DB|nr:U5 small nuclear ribonucleoprotein TSSC4-like [Acipenser ruthenus]XP_058858592.1 U5 small nuclear ribonucleoprotein TSSC4-like [Acipenser ruthenus]XP_058858593.1 U5 small nuclear ribonucleoprotein TSSC4-like [Acipenser ruthenus]XP_058858594.1 U5 small nuclear ribonucleoprotein TSSC4-like [Acipenser ruthenus]XP_058858595.1 U5 small nuclear ribonucleoprotein TSSC4-like [Acipenser ruthenus]XP_058858596.1 U5 small nuclear ribonucleoprotein TSSC4-like [Acipenser ruthenus]XP_058858597.1 U5 small